MADRSLNPAADAAAADHGAAGDAERLQFGPFTLDLRRGELRRAGQAVALRPKPFALLSVLARQPGRVLSKDELMREVWPGVVVTDDSLTRCVHELRRALGADAAALLRTVARRGYRFDADVRRPEEAGPAGAEPPARRHPFAGAVTAMVLAMLVAAAGAWWWGSRDDASERPPPLSLAVLPLAVPADEADARWFADGLCSDLTTELGRLPGVLVISRETAAAVMRSGAADPRAIGRELRVRYVVSGAVQRDAAGVGLRLAMVDGASGQQLWAESQQLDRAALAPALRDIVDRVARILAVQMYRSSGAAADRLEPARVQADDLAMQGFSVYFRGMTPENLKAARQRFDAAVTADPRSLRGWGGIASVAGMAGALNWMPRAETLQQLRQAAEHLQAIDADSHYTYMARSFIAYLTDDWPGYLLVSSTMAERFSSHPSGHIGRALSQAAFGRFDDCIVDAERAARVGPLDYNAAVARFVVGVCHYMRGDAAEAARHARSAHQANPRLPSPPLLLAAALAQTGREDEARAIVAEYTSRNPDFRAEHIARLLRGQDPRYLAGRDRIVQTLHALGMP